MAKTSTVRAGWVVLFAIIVISLIPANAAASSTPLSGGVTRKMHILAVGEAGGKYFGVATELEVTVTNGSGMVYISTEPLSEVDMQASARLAALVACYVAGKDYYSYNYFISVRSNSTIVGGPSAGAAMTVAIVAALLNKPLNDSVVETGMIMPDTTIGPVGGIPEKLQAAADVGAKVMLIPAGQRISYSLAERRNVDVVKLGEEKGIKVVEVSTIYDALAWFGINISRAPKAEARLSPEALNVVKGWINSTRESYLEMKVKAESEALKAPEVSVLVTAYLRGARTHYIRSSSDISSGKYYSAASDLFAALINATTAYWIAAIAAGDLKYSDILQNVSAEVDEALRTYSEVREDVMQNTDVAKLSIAVEIAMRALEANESLHELPEQVLNAGTVYSAAYTYYRARTVMDWREMYEAVPPSGIVVGSSRLDKYASLLAYFSKTSASYIESLVGSSYTSSTVRDILEMSEEASLLVHKDPVAALAYALRASALSSALLNMVFTTDLGNVADRLREVALTAAGEAISSGFMPTAALSYIERADSLRGVDDGTAIYYYDLALTNTLWYMVISGGKKAVVTTQTPTSTTTTTPTQTTGGSGSEFPSIGNWLTQGWLSDIIVVVGVVVIAAVAGILLGLLGAKSRS
ncbi:MAG: hypothetical protein DRO10_00495 [Thermoprotei archaeon]|nr:MAG: hypothetical protein DRO10_00495 [Thermoprotei archaeon]